MLSINAKTLKGILCIRKPDRLAMSEETDTVQWDCNEKIPFCKTNGSLPANLRSMVGLDDLGILFQP